MNLQIGENIKKLRIEQNITQEKLAEYLNVSYQTVSKWENGITLPSITILPAIANVFNVSIDELYDLEGNDKSEKIRKYKEEYTRLCNNGDNKGRVELMRKALAEFPRNYEFMNYLARSIYWYNFSDEIFALCERILDECTEDTIRFSALQTISRAYASIGQTDKAREYAMKIPPIKKSRELLLAELSEGEEQKHWIQNNLLLSLDIAAKMLAYLGDYKTEPKERIEFYEKSDMLYQLILDDNNLWINVSLYYTYERIAHNYCLLGDMGKAIEYILLAEKSAREADEFFNSKEAKSFTSKFLEGFEVYPAYFKKHWQGSHCRNLYRKLQQSLFDGIRDTDKFKAVVERLKEADKEESI